MADDRKRWFFPHAGPVDRTGKTLVMGIINLTPDSFSGGGRAFAGSGEAARAALDLFAAGADIVDIGAESSRPGAAAISDAEEISRLGDVVKRVRAGTDRPISVDTYHAAGAAYVLDQGADMINDISALRLGWDKDAADNQALAGEIARRSAHVVLMHMPAAPAVMQDRPFYHDVFREVGDFLLCRAAFAKRSGIGEGNIWLDPGFGFGKTFAHNRELLLRLSEYASFGYPLLAGLSRKRMIRDALGLPAGERLEASLALAVLAASNGAAAVRVHDVRATVRAVGMVDALKSDG